MGFLVQKVEHWRTKLKVACSSPAEVHFFSYPAKKKLLYSDNTDQAGFGCPGLE